MRRVSSLFWAGLAGLAIACGEPVAPPSGGFERVAAGAFPPEPAPEPAPAFDVVATDLDLDGDPDLLVSWHHVGPLELFENEGGRFEAVDTPGRKASGLFDLPGVPDLFAEVAELEPRILGSGVAGLYVWHDADRLGSWRFLWHDPERRHPRFTLALESSRGFAKIEGLDRGSMKRSGARQLTISGGRLGRLRRFAFETPALTVRLRPHARAGSPAALPPVFVGRDLTPVPGRTIELWKPDPHGLAWVDVEGSPHPELWITRGGLAGTLLPPFLGKRDRYFVHRGGGEPLYRPAPPVTVPREYRRGRQVEWLDVDDDGRLELSVTGRGSPNGLLVRDPAAGAFHDVASSLGLASRDGEVASWGDLDEDGLPDLFVLGSDAIDVAVNRGPGVRFAQRPGAELGLAVPATGRGAPALFEFASLRQADFDNDGRLDLWLLGHGPDRTNHLFLRRGEGFEDVSRAVGLAAIRGNDVTVLLDADNDAFLDAVGFGPDGARLWRNHRGERFELVPLSSQTVPERIGAAVAGDFDGDGATDLVVVGRRRHFLRNRAAGANGFVDVALRRSGGEPIGALVRAFYADGTAAIQRYGSMRNSGFSQSLQPLHFGIPAGVALERIGVRWPGERAEEVFEIGPPNRLVVLERGAGFEAADDE